jgi:hypothetical protein
MNELITLETLPVITQQLEAKSKEIKQKTADYMSMVCNNETLQFVKAARAELNNERKEVEAQRIQMKSKLLEPYKKFLKIYKEFITDIYDEADEDLKNKINEVEDEIKGRMEDEVRAYFSEYLSDFPHIDFLDFERVGLNITKTAGVEKLKKQCFDFINRVADDLDMIATQPNQAEILVEYVVGLNAAQAITTIAAKHKAIEAQKAIIEAQKQAYAPILEEIKLPVIEEPEEDYFPPVAWVKFIDHFGDFTGREYSYLVPEDGSFAPGMVLELDTKNGKTDGQIIRFGTTKEVPANVFPFLKYLPVPEVSIPLPSFEEEDAITITFEVTDTAEKIEELKSWLSRAGYQATYQIGGKWE